MAKPSSYFTVTMVICLIYSMSKWISTYSELWPSIGIPPIVALLLERFWPRLNKREIVNASLGKVCGI
ncbi:hypothetical protein Goshw_012679 [Gossypium schwendimanii]|uniref:Uncharacterized protein n=2 Tax=Gossypium schwendimanii TaxID=34291 RepID=A0A7J9L9H9_GOSSC|nr:hypothetical protein [Gossypium schwendimanii]